MNISHNRTFTLLMISGIAVCTAMLPWKRWFTDPDAQLTARVAQYAKLRQDGDWVSVYGIMVEQERKAVSLTQFLALYGSSPLRVVNVSESKRTIDVPKGEATVTLSLDAELQLDKLPPQLRRTLTVQDPSQLRKTEAFETRWSWNSGDWWLRMDEEALTGRREGKDIKPFDTKAQVGAESSATRKP